MSRVPRVNAKSLKTHTGGEVRFVGKVNNVDATSATLTSSDGMSVTVKTSTPQYFQTAFVEVVGTVNSDFSLTSSAVTALSDNMDLKTYDQMVELISSRFAYLV